MSLAFIVYLISVIPKLAALATVTAMCSTFGFIIYSAVCSVEGFELKYKKTVITLILSSSLLAVAIPSEKQMYMIAGAYATQEVYNSEIGQDTIKLIHAKIKEQLDEVQKKVGE